MNDRRLEVEQKSLLTDGDLQANMTGGGDVQWTLCIDCGEWSCLVSVTDHVTSDIKRNTLFIVCTSL